MNRLRKGRMAMGVAITIFATLLFLDFTGSVHSYLGWIARVQFLPALLSLNLIILGVLILLTLIFGRLYCSVLCPLGVLQDGISRVASAITPKRKFSYSAPKTILRYVMVLLLVGALVAGVGSVVAILDPYGSFGLIVSNLLSPIYRGANNLLAMAAEHYDSYAFYTREVIVYSLAVISFSVAILALVSYLAWRGGRTYCNTICPVGTILGIISKYSWFKITVDADKCNGCRKCVRECKSGCITSEDRSIDYSRCVVCFDCIDSCNQGAISYTTRRGEAARKAESKGSEAKVDKSRRDMLAISATLLTSTIVKGEAKMFDGGLAVIEDKLIPDRNNYIVPPGSCSHRNFAKHCTGCQLCVSACPNDVLRPATGLTNFLQPQLSFERGYCRPECTKCSEVCPTGAIEKIDRAEKSSIQIGHAVLIESNCVVLTDGVECGNCAAHCPTGAILMVAAEDPKYGGRKIPCVDTSRCIGCGACENLCPSRPFSAIYVEGHIMHSTL